MSVRVKTAYLLDSDLVEGIESMLDTLRHDTGLVWLDTDLKPPHTINPSNSAIESPSIPHCLLREIAYLYVP